MLLNVNNSADIATASILGGHSASENQVNSYETNTGKYTYH